MKRLDRFRTSADLFLGFITVLMLAGLLVDQRLIETGHPGLIDYLRRVNNFLNQSIGPTIIAASAIIVILVLSVPEYYIAVKQSRQSGNAIESTSIKRLSLSAGLILLIIGVMSVTS